MPGNWYKHTGSYATKKQTVVTVHLDKWYVCSRPWTREESFVQICVTFLLILVWYVEVNLWRIWISSNVFPFQTDNVGLLELG